MNLHDRERPAGNPYPRRGGGHVPGRPDFLTLLADSARENPMSAALIGMGALWLFMGGNRMSLLGGRGKTSMLGVAAHGAESLVAGAAHGVARAGSAVTSGVSSAASGLTESVSEGIGRVGDYVSGTAHGVESQSEYSKAGMSRAAMARDSMADVLEKHPLALGMAGLVLGMGVAASIPVTETERDVIGNARDAVSDKVAQATQQAKEFAGDLVSEAKQQSLGAPR